jgi:hypothetical protein
MVTSSSSVSPSMFATQIYFEQIDFVKLGMNFVPLEIITVYTDTNMVVVSTAYSGCPRYTCWPGD